jgi:hypothetical protein
VVKLKFDSTKLTISESQFWVLLVVTNKNHGQPFVQYADVLSVLAASDPLLVSEEKASRKMI